MLTTLVQRLARNGGLVHRSEALDCGLTPSRIDLMLQAGELVPVRRGVYADAEVWDALDELRGRPLLRVRAATMTLQRGWVLSHDSAALTLGMPLLDPRGSIVHVTRAGYTSAWTRADIKRHYARYRLSQRRTSEDGTDVLSMARTAVDLAREHGEDAGLVACDWVLRQGVPRAELLEAVADMASWPGVVVSRTVVDLADPRAESAHESLGRKLVRELEVGPVDPQFPIQLSRQVAWCDLRVGNHVFEMQGKAKYVPVARGGLASTAPEEVVWAEKLRNREIQSRDLGLSEIVWSDYFGTRRQEAKQRLRSEYETTRRRFGDVLHPSLAADAERLRALHGHRDRSA